MVTVWFGVGQFLSGAMGQLYPGGDRSQKNFVVVNSPNPQFQTYARSWTRW